MRSDKKSEKIKLLVTGDFCPAGRIDELASSGKSASIFQDFSIFLEDNDLNIANLECPLTDVPRPVAKNGPHLRASGQAIEALKEGRFNLLALANNHILDHGEEGLENTIRLCEENGMEHVGAGKNIEEASKILYKTIKQKKFAFLNFCEEEFSIASQKSAGANPLNPVKNFYEIQKARENADYVIILIHGGHEGYNLPSPRMVSTYRFFIDAGADVVVGSHTHCFSGCEEYKKGLIFYSLGNFLFDGDESSDISWYYGFAVYLKFDDREISFEILPYNQCEKNLAIKPLTGIARDEFNNRLAQLNDIIKNKESLEHEWKRFVEKNKQFYRISFECFNSRLYKFLRSRKLIPGFLSKKKRLVLLNTHSCDSHRDIAIESLKE